jgi:hypothetical protein
MGLLPAAEYRRPLFGSKWDVWDLKLLQQCCWISGLVVWIVLKRLESLLENLWRFAIFEVLIGMSMKIMDLRDITLCSVVEELLPSSSWVEEWTLKKVSRFCFKTSLYFYQTTQCHMSEDKICLRNVAIFLPDYTVSHVRRQNMSPKHRYISTRLHSVTCQKTICSW